MGDPLKLPHTIENLRDVTCTLCNKVVDELDFEVQTHADGVVSMTNGVTSYGDRSADSPGATVLCPKCGQVVANLPSADCLFEQLRSIVEDELEDDPDVRTVHLEFNYWKYNKPKEG